jgi:DNA-binding LacI/PurR family transcriptional regulator
MSDYTPQEQQPAGLTIGLLTTFISERKLMAQWRGVAEAARQRQANLITYVGGVQRQNERTPENFVFELAQNDRTNGLIIWSGNILAMVGDDEVNRFIEPYRVKQPVISCEKPAEGAATILMEDYEGMRQMVRHLIDVHGRRRIVFMRGLKTYPGAAERYRGYCDALLDAEFFWIRLWLPMPNAGEMILNLPSKNVWQPCT